MIYLTVIIVCLSETMDSTEKWTQLHLPVKILKLLVHDLQKVSSSEESKVHNYVCVCVCGMCVRVRYVCACAVCECVCSM